MCIIVTKVSIVAIEYVVCMSVCVCMWVDVSKLRDGNDSIRNSLLRPLSQDLLLRYNKISKIHPSAFLGLHTLETLDISYNQLTVMPSIADVEITLKTLNLSWNYIMYISDSYFNLCSAIENIELCCNMLNDIPNMRGISRTVQYISLGGNNISKAQPLYGIRFASLRDLSLSSNQIRNFCFPPLSFVPQLNRISLASNNLSYIYLAHQVRRRTGTIQILLNNNPWNCNTSYGWIQYCTQEPSNNLLCMGWLMVEGMICSNPQQHFFEETGRQILCNTKSVWLDRWTQTPHIVFCVSTEADTLISKYTTCNTVQRKK